MVVGALREALGRPQRDASDMIYRGILSRIQEARLAADEHTATVTIRGAATFLGLPKLASALESLQSESTVHVDLDQLSYIDHACLDLLQNWSRQHEANGGTVHVDWDGIHARNAAKARPNARTPEAT